MLWNVGGAKSGAEHEIIMAKDGLFEKTGCFLQNFQIRVRARNLDGISKLKKSVAAFYTAFAIFLESEVPPNLRSVGSTGAPKVIRSLRAREGPPDCASQNPPGGHL